MEKELDLSKYPKGIRHAIEQRAIEILHAASIAYKKPFKVVGIFRTTDGRDRLILDLYPTQEGALAQVRALRIAVNELNRA